MLHLFYLANAVVVSSLRQQENPELARIEASHSTLHLRFLSMLADTLSGRIDPEKKFLDFDELEVGAHKYDNFVHGVVVMELIPELPLEELEPEI